VDTAFQWIGRDHDIIVEAYDDPGVQGVTCYVSRARIGGIKGTLGLAEDRAEASIACRQVGPSASPSRSRSRKKCSANACPSCSSACASCAWWTPSATRWCT
jgi:CreA protein